MKKCKVCGESLSEKFNFCPNCGDQINKKTSKNFSPNNQQNNKAISVKFVVISFLVLLIIGTSILYFSGIFDAHKIENHNQSVNNQANTGADLSKLEEINNLENILKSNPEDYKTLLDLAHLLNDSGFKEKAIEKYQQYLKKFPKEADVLVDMGVCYYELGQNQNAIMYMKEALKYQPKHQIAHLNLGIVHLAIDEKEKSKDYWKKAVEINPNNEIGKRAQELINSL
ncbi:MAG: tetratricopeptide repeat protein [Melioribacteraceae bacterium]|nr:tetratricopeptide repeat protein [Melioribacteraceae bacterium]